MAKFDFTILIILLSTRVLKKELVLNKVRRFQVPNAPIANYVGYVRTGNLIYLSGSGPDNAFKGVSRGKLGKDVTIEEGAEAARHVGINLIANLKSAIGDLNRVKRIVKVLGMVNSTETFTDQPKVINGFSDLMFQVFGEKGKHARSAVVMISLPMNLAVEIERFFRAQPFGLGPIL